MQRSALLFGWGLLHRFFLLVPGILLGVLNLVEMATGATIAVPGWVFWSVLGVGVLVAAFLTFHELRASTSSDATREGRRQVADELGQIINEGETMADFWPGVAFTEQEAWELATTWWNGAGVFIEAILGPGERHIISEPLSGSSREDLLKKHCNLLRGVLKRLPGADLRIEGQELAEAIAARQATGYPQDRQAT